MLTKDLFGINLLTLIGLLMTGFGLTLQRLARADLPIPERDGDRDRTGTSPGCTRAGGRIDPFRAMTTCAKPARSSFVLEQAVPKSGETSGIRR